VEALFGILGLVPEERNAKVLEASVTWNYTTFLNIAFLAFTAVLVARFLATGGPAMLRMMNRPAEEPVAPSSRGGGTMSEHTDGATEFTCPMHPEVVSQSPGRCPKCGMDLVPRAEVQKQ
jgi:hypothetical protein